MKTLVVGASGFLGNYLMNYFNCPGTSFSGQPGHIRLDVCNLDEFILLLDKIKPDLVINSSGFTNVDLCESNRDIALRINGTAVGNMARACRTAGTKFAHLSTDFVFNGTKGDYIEIDETDPINYYGKSKLVGEREAFVNDAIILRISTPFGISHTKGKTPFNEFVINNVKAGNPVRIANNQITTPTFAEDIPHAIDVLAESGSSGIFHLGVKEKMSRYEFAVTMVERFGMNTDLIIPVELKDLPLVAERPLNTAMNSGKISGYFRPSSLSHGIDKIISELQPAKD